MAYLALFIALGIFLAIAGWQLAVWLVETRDKNSKYRAATACAKKSGKQLLIAGGPWGVTKTRRRLNKPAHGSGDVCLDIDRRALGDHPRGVVASVTHIPFSDKCFGAAFASHLLEHLPTVADGKQALEELNRVAEAVFIVSPSRQSFSGWLTRGHHLWVWQKGSLTYFKQRGKARGKDFLAVDSSAKG
ncbi:MAG TPA: class I SAM-dependent methyltransferase [Dehalococcoidia bacterium]|nr:class I SAM-dependent methyltransferase [Dehalococcoidia bacterium]